MWKERGNNLWLENAIFGATLPSQHWLSQHWPHRQPGTRCSGYSLWATPPRNNFTWVGKASWHLLLLYLMAGSWADGYPANPIDNRLDMHVLYGSGEMPLRHYSDQAVLLPPIRSRVFAYVRYEGTAVGPPVGQPQPSAPPGSCTAAAPQYITTPPPHICNLCFI